MNSENIYRYLGITAVMLIIIYLGFKGLNLQTGVLEGLTNNEPSSISNTNTRTTTGGSVETANFLDNVAGKSADAIKSQNDKLADVIAIDKYRTDYENLLIALDEYTKNMILSKIISVGSKVATLPRGSVINDAVIADITSANNLKTFIDTLNSAMTFMDKTKKQSRGMFGM
jgi:hypothetical protein